MSGLLPCSNMLASVPAPPIRADISTTEQTTQTVATRTLAPAQYSPMHALPRPPSWSTATTTAITTPRSNKRTLEELNNPPPQQADLPPTPTTRQPDIHQIDPTLSQPEDPKETIKFPPPPAYASWPDLSQSSDSAIDDEDPQHRSLVSSQSYSHLPSGTLARRPPPPTKTSSLLFLAPPPPHCRLVCATTPPSLPLNLSSDSTFSSSSPGPIEHDSSTDAHQKTTRK